MQPIPVGKIKALWRYPVKSMVGESIEHARIEKQGLAGDRQWAVRDENLGQLTVVRRTPRLLLCSARQVSDGVGDEVPAVEITLPDGETLMSDDALAEQRLSELLGKPVSLWPLQRASNWRHYRLKGVLGASEIKRQFGTSELPDLSSVPLLISGQLSFFVTPPGRYHDVFPLHILSTNALRKMRSLQPEADFSVARFRPNIVIESAEPGEEFDDFSWLGGRLMIGETVVDCASRTVRCSAPAQPQAGGVAKDGKVVRTLDKHTSRHAGINATVRRAGHIEVGQAVFWLPGKSLLPAPVAHAGKRLKNAFSHSLLKLNDRLGAR